MKITLCGSTRFKADFDKYNRMFSLRGHIVYSCAVFQHAGDPPLTDEEKLILDEVHRGKIANSDAIFVVGVIQDRQPENIVLRPYIGESTQREIAWARLLNRLIFTEANLDHMSKALQPPPMVVPRQNLETHPGATLGIPEDTRVVANG